MDIEILRDFIAVVDAGSLTKAAANRCVSQPAISQRMSQLERQLKARLLDRGPRGVEPTAVGLELYRGAQQVVRQFDRLAALVADEGTGIRGEVSIGLPATVAGFLVPILFSETRQRHPGIHLELFEAMSGYIEELLVRGRLDLAMLFRDDASPRPGETVLYHEDLYLATAANQDASTAPISVVELADRPLVSPGPGNNLRELLERATAEHGFAPQVVADVYSPAAMVRVAQSGLASTVLPRSAAHGHSGPALALRPLVEPTIRRWVSVCVAPEFFEPQAAVNAVREDLVSVIRILAARDAALGLTPFQEPHPQPPTGPGGNVTPTPSNQPDTTTRKDHAR